MQKERPVSETSIETGGEHQTPEREIAVDLFRRGLMISPILLALCPFFGASMDWHAAELVLGWCSLTFLWALGSLTGQ